MECSTDEPRAELSNRQILLYVNDALEKRVIRGMLNPNASGKPLPIYFTGGGEPTYGFDAFRDLIISIRDKAKEYNIPISLRITTNGVYGIERMSFLCDNFSSIMISYDGMPSIQDNNRPGIYHKNTSKIVESNIRYVISRHVPLSIRSTILPKDISALKHMADYMYKNFGKGFKWSLYPVKAKGRAIGKGFENAENDADADFCDAFLSLHEYVQKHYGDVHISSPIFTMDKVDLFCGSIASRADITWLRADGRIVTCLEMGNEETKVGCVKKDAVIYNTEVTDAITRITQERMSRCSKCIAFPFCRGGCPADHRNDNNANELTWGCRQTIKFWTHIIGEVALGKKCFGWKVLPSRFDFFKDLGILEFSRGER